MTQTFAFVALDGTGRTQHGTLNADSRAAAMEQVVGRGLEPLSIEPASGGKRAGIGLTKANASHAGGRLPRKAVEAFTAELANLLAAGLSLSRALALLKREASHPAAQAAWGQVHDDVVGGEPLHGALSRFPQAFSQVYVAMVRAGEAGGFLPLVLQQISDFRQREQDLLGKVKAAMIYPIVLATVATGVLIFLLSFFIPRFAPIFSQFGSNLPVLTQVVVKISHWLTHNGPLLALLAILTVLGVRRWYASDLGRRQWERLLLRLPALGTLTARFALVRFARMLGTLLHAGVPLVSALQVAREALGNQTLCDAVNHAIEAVRQGEALSRALSVNRQLFPPSVLEMVSVAEETGRLDHELIRLATAYESDLDRHLRMTVALVEPLLLILMASLIGTVVVSMLLPVFTLQDLIN